MFQVCFILAELKHFFLTSGALAFSYDYHVSLMQPNTIHETSFCQPRKVINSFLQIIMC